MNNSLEEKCNDIFYDLQIKFLTDALFQYKEKPSTDLERRYTNAPIDFMRTNLLHAFRSAFTGTDDGRFSICNQFIQYTKHNPEKKVIDALNKALLPHAVRLAATNLNAYDFAYFYTEVNKVLTMINEKWLSEHKK